MNRIFRIIWSKAQRTWVVVSELATSHGKSGGNVDKRVGTAEAVLDRDEVEGSQPAQAWPLRLGILVALLALYAPSRAADRYWDVNGNTAGLGGTGTWNGSNLFWNDNSTGTGGTVFAWNNVALDDAFFGGTAGTVTLGAPITAHSLNFLANGYTLTGNTLTLAGANPFISTTGGNTATINSVLAGSNGLTVNGTSTSGWIMLGGNNTLTGGITVNNNARLVASGSNSLNGAANVVTVNSGGVLQVNHANAFGGNTAASNLVINSGGNLWLGGISLTHNVTAAGGGTININQPFANLNSTWTGNLTLTADTTLQVTNTGDNGNLTFAGNLTDTGANRLSLLLNEGGGIDSSLFLTGTNSFTGGITINSGQIVARGADALGGAAGNVVTINGSNSILRARGDAFGGDTDASQLILNNGGRLRVDDNQTLNHDVTFNGGTVNIDGIGNARWNGTPLLTADTLLNLGVSNNNLTVGGPLQDTGANVLSVTTQGNANVRFNGDLSFSGDLTLASGATWFDGGNYTYSGDTIISTNSRLLLNGGSVSPNSNIRFEGLNNTHLTVIYGTNAQSSITMPNGAGGGELRWAGTGGFYALNNQSDVTVNLGGAGATLTWNDGLFVPDGHALILGTNVTGGDARQVDFQNGIDLSGGLRDVRVDNGNINDHAVLSGVLTGTGGLHVIGNGLLELTNAGNDYSGATVVGDATTNNVGNLLLGAAGVLSPNSNLQINGASNGTLEQHGGYVLLNAASGPFTRALGTGAGQVQWTGSGGFGAIGAPQTVDIGGAGATLTWGSGGFVPTGSALRFGGNYSNSTINWQNGIDLGATDRVINVNEGVGAGWNDNDREVNLNGVIQGTGGLILRGQGDLALNALNTYSGTTWIGGTGTTEGSNMWVWANTLADAGVASSLGAGSTVVLNSHNGGLIYTGGATSTNRTLALNRTAGANHYLLNYGTGALTWTGDVTTTGSGQNNFRLGGRYSTTLDANGVAIAPNVISGVISDGTGVTRVFGWNGTGSSCTTGDTWRLTGANTFTGELVPFCVFEVSTIADAGVASAVGAGNLIADYRSADGTVRYIGSGDTSDRLFWAWGNSHLESSGTGALQLTNTGIVVSQNGGFTHWLGGTNTDDNTLAATLVNSPTPVEVTTSWFRLGKEGPGLWALVTDNNANANAYSGMTRIFGGALRLDNAGAITGGLGVTSSHGTTGSSQRSSLIRFEGTADGTGGVLGLTAASGGFFRGVTTAADAFVNNNGTTIGADPDGAGPLPAYGIEALDDDNYIQGVRWFGSGGFAAWDGTQVVNLFGDGREVTWGASGFVPTNHQLVFGYVTADGTVDFQNGVNLGSAARTVWVNDGLSDRDAIMSGVLRSTTVLGGLTKAGAGTLTLTANNTYTGNTTVSAGTLEVGDGSTTGTLGSGAQAIVASGATLVSNRANGYTLSQNVIGDGTLVQRGTGTTTMTANSDIDHVVLEQGTLVTPGTLLTNDVTFTDDGGATLRVAGTLQTSAAGAALVTGGTGSDTIRIDAGATLRANGGLGDGNDTLDVAGTLDTMGGVFDLAAGDDSFVIHDNTNVLGTVDGGDGSDTLDATIATTANLAVVLNFETLDKNGAGTLNINGPGTSDFATVNVNAGTLNVAAGAGVAAAAGGTIDTIVAAGATLNVDGAFGCGDGNDSITIAGNVSGTGTIDQCGGDDLLTVQDGANVDGYTGVFNGGAHTAGIGDTVQLDIATTLDFAQGTVTNYENLLKSNVGTATLSGDHTYDSTTIAGGTLDVDGSLATPAIAMTGDGTTLNVDGLVQAPGATQTTITGSAGTNTVNVNAGATLLASADLGDGADVLDLAGALDTGAGVFAFGAGDDTLILNDGADLSQANAIDGGDHGAGDTVILDNALAMTLDASEIVNFEFLVKNQAGEATLTGTLDFSGGTTLNTGTLTVDGTLETPTVALADDTVLNVDGTLQGNGGGYAMLTGSAGTNTVSVAEGALLQAGGDLGDGNDVLDVAGTLDTNGGVFDLGAGDDTFVIHDSTVALGTVDGGDGIDLLDVIISSGNTASLDSLFGFESLAKDGGGTLQINGTAEFVDVDVLAGVLDVTGNVTAQNTTVEAGATLQLSGNYDGTAGDDTFVVAGTVTSSGAIDLGEGNDVLDVSGVLDTGGGTFALGGGDDSFVVHDGTVVLGTVDGGDGLDTRVYDINLNADVGALLNFEGITKTGAGTLNLNGPGATDLQEVQVLGGTLNVGAGASVIATPGSTLDTLVATGATLNVDGSFGCGDGNDTLSVAGTVSGSGTIELCGGDDLLTLSDGADLTGLLNPIDGGAHGTGDTVALDFGGDYTFADSQTVNFEILNKQNSGTVTLTGTQTWETVQLDGGALTVDALSTLFAPSLAMADDTVFQVDGFAGGGPLLTDTMTITGSDGVNTVIVADGGLLRANGGLGDGDDVLDVAGTLDTNGGIFDLGAGDDRFIVHDTTSVLGAVDGGAGIDLLEVNVSGGNTVPLGTLLGFESLGKSGEGALQINGVSEFIDVELLAGTLEVTAGGSVAAENTTVAAGSTLLIDGSYAGTAGDDTMTVAGAVTGSGTLGLGGGNDTFTIQDGADLSGLLNPVDGGTGADTFVADIAGDATLGGAINFETLSKTNTGTLHIDGPVSSSFDTVNVEAGTLDIGVSGSVAAPAGGTLDTVIAAGATLNVDGSYGCGDGDDTMSVSGTVSGSGTIDLCGGDDVLTLNDGAVLTNVISGGSEGSGDTVALNNAGALTFDVSNTVDFEFLVKDNSGEATLVGTQSFTGGTSVNAGILTVSGALETPTVTLADDTVLNVSGTLQGNGGGYAGIAGSSGINTVNVAVGGLLQATGDLGDGHDVLDVAGTLDAGGGTFALGAGDDSFVVHDGTVVNGTVDGGAGFDTRVYDINLTADLGALVNFEGVTKTGTGTLNINGPGATDLQEVQVLGGTLYVGPDAGVVATAGSTLDTVVGAGATLQVDGSFGCGDGSDTLSVAGTVSGSGTIDLCGGEDTLTLNDGAVLNATISGGGHGSGDTVVLNAAAALSFDGSNVINFENLQKDNTGEATLTGAQTFSGGTTINGGTLTVAGSLETPTVAMADDAVLNVDGTLQGDGGGYATITGSVGVNTVTVSEGALLQASGDLGDGSDVLDVAGTLDTNGGVFELGAGDDMFVVHDSTAVLGTVDGGLGNDMLNVTISAGNLVPLGSMLGFESLGKSGEGALQINGPSEFIDVDVFGGVLEVSASGTIAAQNTTVASGATLQIDGAYTGTDGADTFTVAGMVTGSGTVALGDGDDTFAIQDGADLSGLLTPVDGGAGIDTFNADIAGEATLGGAINFETLTKTNTGTLHVDGPAASAFDTVIVDSGTLDIGVDGSLNGVQSSYVAAGAMLNVDGSFTGTDGNDVMEAAGTLLGSGTIALADGDDQLILMQGADLGGLVNALDGGAGTDTIQAWVDSTMVLGPTVNFETLSKGGNGELIVAADQGFVTTSIDQGTLTVADGITLSSQDTTVNVGATLVVQGTFTGTDGDDSFLSMGTVNGALSFGAGDDTAHFIGGNLSGLTGVDGGAGNGDVLSFSLQELEGEHFDTIAGWERVELLSNSSLTLDSALDLGGGTLFIDNTSRWTANDGASLTGSVENSGHIDVGANRVAISGNYTGGSGLLEVTVSPANGTSGGLDIAGNVSGTTGVIFASDGTDVTQPTNILVISAPNAAAGAFAPVQLVDGFVRLEGSVFPWAFEQSGTDNNWYLGTDGGGVLPEIPGYAVLPTIGALMAEQSGDPVHQRLAGVRGDATGCGAKATTERAGADLVDDCHGFWVAAATNELELGANPGFELSGDDVGLYVGFDQAVDRDNRILRFGGYLGLLHANYWTSGVNSTDLPGVGESEIDLDTPVGGLYFSNQWTNGGYVDVVLSGQRPRAYVRTADGFDERLVGNSLTLSARVGWRYALRSGWVLEPQVQLTTSQVHWQDTVDAGGRALAIDDDLISTAHAGLRVEKEITTAAGALVRPWVMLAVQDTFGEKANALEVTATGPNATPQLFPNHDRGLAASLDVGVEATLSERVSLFGVVSVGQDMDGTDYEYRAANVGVRLRW